MKAMQKKLHLSIKLKFEIWGHKRAWFFSPLWITLHYFYMVLRVKGHQFHFKRVGGRILFFLCHYLTTGNNKPSPPSNPRLHDAPSHSCLLSLVTHRSEPPLLRPCLFKRAENTYQRLRLPIVAAAYHDSPVRDNWAPERSESRNENIFHHALEFHTYLPTTPSDI